MKERKVRNKVLFFLNNQVMKRKFQVSFQDSQEVSLDFMFTNSVTFKMDVTQLEDIIILEV